MTGDTSESVWESALLVTASAAEAAVAEHRARHDLAAAVGVPAHLTILYPFRPAAALTSRDLAELRTLFAARPAFEVVFARTAWFGEDVLYLAPNDPEPLIGLTRAVEAAFPGVRAYGGAFDDVVPHLTIGHGDPRTLRDVELSVRRHLPIRQRVTQVELWEGPPPAGARGTWSQVLTFPLGG